MDVPCDVRCKVNENVYKLTLCFILELTYFVLPFVVLYAKYLSFKKIKIKLKCVSALVLVGKLRHFVLLRI
jgi:hypothetical protein